MPRTLYCLLLTVALAACGARSPSGAFGGDASADRGSAEDASDAPPPEDTPLATPDTGPRCEAEQTLCDGACVDLRTDRNHCTRCGRACLDGQSCVNGFCTIVCAAGEYVCAGMCVNYSTSSQNCGFCGNACRIPHALSSCRGGSCAIGECDSQYGNCDGDPSNGCEADLVNSASNCGACGNRCGTGRTCVRRVCTP